MGSSANDQDDINYSRRRASAPPAYPGGTESLRDIYAKLPADPLGLNDLSQDPLVKKAAKLIVSEATGPQKYGVRTGNTIKIDLFDRANIDLDPTRCDFLEADFAKHTNLRVKFEYVSTGMYNQCGYVVTITQV
jgi:hypothetical protein